MLSLLYSTQTDSGDSLEHGNWLQIISVGFCVWAKFWEPDERKFSCYKFCFKFYEYHLLPVEVLDYLLYINASWYFQQAL